MKVKIVIFLFVFLFIVISFSRVDALNNEKCVYARFKTAAIGSGKISYPAKWKKVRHNRKKEIVLILKKNRTSMVYFAGINTIPLVLTLRYMTRYFRKSEVKSGKIPLSPVKKFITCSGTEGYSFYVKSFFDNGRSFYQYYIYLVDESGKLYQVIFSSTAKKNYKKPRSQKILKSINFAQ